MRERRYDLRDGELVLNHVFAVNPLQGSLAIPTFEKKLFSMVTPEVTAHISALPPSPPTSYVLFGIEAHVCVQQTCLDLLSEGHDVHVVVDGVSSQSPLDREVALER